jgi:hypothetical protein
MSSLLKYQYVSKQHFPQKHLSEGLTFAQWHTSTVEKSDRSSRYP